MRRHRATCDSVRMLPAASRNARRTTWSRSTSSGLPCRFLRNSSIGANALRRIACQSACRVRWCSIATAMRIGSRSSAERREVWPSAARTSAIVSYDARAGWFGARGGVDGSVARDIARRLIFDGVREGLHGGWLRAAWFVCRRCPHQLRRAMLWRGCAEAGFCGAREGAGIWLRREGRAASHSLGTASAQPRRSLPGGWLRRVRGGRRGQKGSGTSRERRREGLTRAGTSVRAKFWIPSAVGSRPRAKFWIPSAVGSRRT